jgi:hypothetical protein
VNKERILEILDEHAINSRPPEEWDRIERQNDLFKAASQIESEVHSLLTTSLYNLTRELARVANEVERFREAHAACACTYCTNYRASLAQARAAIGGGK